ncbi:MAG: polyprenyl diphosphate synthase [Candidatus Nealsonbacteria bacterium]|nr:polyprenyl diphosphate synthase [Candidatus Nealsonbacteria bacterium]
MKIPHHLAIIIDGNRRWAKAKGLPTLEGHRRGEKKLKKIGELAWKKGVKILTIFAFSTENWNRSKPEVEYLLHLLGNAFSKKTIEHYHKLGIKIRVIGQKERLSRSLQAKIEHAERLTENNKKGILNLAISYGGRQEIIWAVKNIFKKVKDEKEINEETISKNLWTEGIPDPDLIIRTGGETRLSNFLTWQSIYSELYFTNKYWPDFNERDLEEAFKNYSSRERRFGK